MLQQQAVEHQALGLQQLTQLHITHPRQNSSGGNPLSAFQSANGDVHSQHELNGSFDEQVEADAHSSRTNIIGNEVDVLEERDLNQAVAPFGFPGMARGTKYKHFARQQMQMNPDITSEQIMKEFAKSTGGSTH